MLPHFRYNKYFNRRYEKVSLGDYPWKFRPFEVGVYNNKSSDIGIHFRNTRLLVALQKQQLLRSGIHYGTSLRLFQNLNVLAVSTVFFDFYKNLPIVIFSTYYSALNLKLGLLFTILVVSRRGKIMFADVFPNNYFGKSFKQNGQSYICGKWPTGFFTNFKVLYRFLLKKDVMSMSEDRYISGLRRLPSIVLLPDLFRNFWASKESCRIKLPMVCVNDGSMVSKGVLYTIPANSNTLDSLRLIAYLFSVAVLVGYEDEVRFFYLLLKKRRVKEIFFRKVLIASLKKNHKKEKIKTKLKPN